jgi:hypothetical protein
VNVNYLLAQPPQSVQTKSAGETRTVLSSLFNDHPLSQLDALKDRSDIERIVQAHVHYDAATSRNLAGWLGALPQLTQVGDVLAARLQQYPNDVFALRLEQDIAPPQQRAVVCQQHVEAARQAPENADLQYLALRCMPRGAAQSQAFRAAADRWPRNPWLQLVVGYSELDGGHFDEAARRFAVTFAQIPGAREWVNLDIARARRLRSPDANVDDLLSGSFLLDSFHDLETNGMQRGPAVVWSELIHGNLTKAYQLLPDGRSRLNLTILLAASDGAPTQWADQVLSIAPSPDWTEDMLLYGFALASRQRRDTAPYRTLIASNADESGIKLLDFLQSLQAGKAVDPGVGLVDFSLRDRGLAYTLAVIVKGRAASPSWRDGAKRLLFGTERPYFE